MYENNSKYQRKSTRVQIKQFKFQIEVYQVHHDCLRDVRFFMRGFISGTVIQDISVNKNNSNNYYILSGDSYGLFAINNLGQLYLTSPLLNQTVNEYFQLVILISSPSLSYCQTNISVQRTPKWSHFVCPAVNDLSLVFPHQNNCSLSLSRYQFSG